MPTKTEIHEEINSLRRASEQAPDNVRRRYLRELSSHTGRDTIIYASAFTTKRHERLPSIFLSILTEDIEGFMAALHGLRGDSLDLILHSPGGSLEAAEQIVEYLRGKYRSIRAIVPQNAMSAATMIACACDSIVMGRHSAIGPIDPQMTIQTPSGPYTAPAQAILGEFDEAKEDILKEPRLALLWHKKLDAFPAGLLKQCEYAKKLSEEKVADWLQRYMFRDRPDREALALMVSAWLAKTDEHKSHGRPIMLDLALERGLKVEILEDDQQLQELVLSVFHSTVATFETTACAKLIENQNGRGQYALVERK